MRTAIRPVQCTSCCVSRGLQDILRSPLHDWQHESRQMAHQLLQPEQTPPAAASSATGSESASASLLPSSMASIAGADGLAASSVRFTISCTAVRSARSSSCDRQAAVNLNGGCTLTRAHLLWRRWAPASIEYGKLYTRRHCYPRHCSKCTLFCQQQCRDVPF